MKRRFRHFRTKRPVRSAKGRACPAGACEWFEQSWPITALSLSVLLSVCKQQATYFSNNVMFLRVDYDWQQFTPTRLGAFVLRSELSFRVCVTGPDRKSCLALLLLFSYSPGRECTILLVLPFLRQRTAADRGRALPTIGAWGSCRVRYGADCLRQTRDASRKLEPEQHCPPSS